MALLNKEIKIKLMNLLAIFGMIISMSIAYGEIKADRISIKDDIAVIQGSLQTLNLSVNRNTAEISRLNELLENGIN